MDVQKIRDDFPILQRQIRGRPLIGAQVSVDDVAELADTNAYEVLTRLGNRSEKRYLR